MKNIYKYSLILAILCWSCEQEMKELKPLPEEPSTPTTDPSAGSADFSKYVAVGNSLTAGYQAGALFNEGQDNSLGAILAKQFELVGGGAFNQPDIDSENGFNTLIPNPDPGSGVVLGRLVLQGDPPSPSPIIPGDPIGAFGGDKSSLNNFGVPGILLGQALTPATGGPNIPQNPAFSIFYERFASEPGVSTIIGDAVAAQGTFFSFWLGNNDVLGYAASGGTQEEIFTSVEDFTDQYHGAIALMTSDPDIKGVVGNIPDITAIPFFTTIPYNAVEIDQATADALTQGYAGFNEGINQYNQTPGLPEEQKRPLITFQAGANPIVIEDENLPDLTGAGLPSWRQMVPGELVILRAAAELPQGVGSASPAPDELILTADEVQLINDRVTGFNEAIEGVISAQGLSDRIAIADVNQAFTAIADAGAAGLVSDGVVITAALAPPFGGFSEDGLHPNSRGTAFAANIFIDAINEKFNANVPRVHIAEYQGTGLPQ